MSSSLVQAVIWLIVLANITVVSVYLLRKWRDQASRAETAGDHLAKFRELHQQGILGDQEFRTIKTALDERQRFESGNDRTVN